MNKSFFRASETHTVDAGAQFLFAGLGITQSEQVSSEHRKTIRGTITRT
jgi:hypothetical protein